MKNLKWCGVGLVALASVAHADVSKFEFGVGHSVLDFDWGDQRSVDNDKARFLTGAYNANEEWAFELFYADLDTQSELSGAAVDANQIGLKGLYHLTDRYGIVPYLGLGFAELELQGAQFDRFSEFGLVYVLGAKWQVTERFSLRLEANFDRFEESHDNDQTLWFGLSFGFGQRQSREPVVVSNVSAEPVVSAPTPAPEPVVVAPPKDSDGDGVNDDADRCSATPTGLTVNADGCATLTEKVSIQLHITFDSGKAAIKNTFSNEIQKVVDFMNTYPSSQVVIEGHTDASGDDQKNKVLSQRRADAVAAAIVQGGIAAERVKAVGFGEEKPLADNNTLEGRAQNRRVTAEITEQISSVK